MLELHSEVYKLKAAAYKISECQGVYARD